MCSSRRPSASPQTLKVLCVRLCLLSLAGAPLSAEAARLRCGSDLLSDLIFVCGDRGIYLGKGSWSGYGARPRGKGIVDQCCRPGGCELHHLEMYCAKPRSQQQTTTLPSTTAATTHTPVHTDAAQQFQDVFHRRLLEHLGAPGSAKREAYRKKAQPPPQRKSKDSSSRRRITTQNATDVPLQRTTRPES